MDGNTGAEQMPATIGRYQVVASVGFGAMGAVYKAFDPLIKRTLAIKTIRLDIPRNSPQYKSFIERFYHEARISGTLSHPNIVTLFDIGEEQGLPFLAMEFVEGETLSSLIDRGIRFQPEKVIGLVSQVALAVDYAHSKGVIHRDIKPSNLILHDGDRVKVTDFGIAKLVDAEMTQAGQLLGTPSYMSPEQAMGERIDGRSDIFSLGVCAFEMLSGVQPFPGNNVTSILYKLVHVDPVEPPNLELNGLVPQKWHDVFGKVLAKKPDDRYQTASEFVQDLEYCLGAWFGSAMGEDTLSEKGQAAPPKPGRTTVPPAPKPQAPREPTGEEVTTALPVVQVAPPAPPSPPSVAASARQTTPPGARAPAPPTVVESTSPSQPAFEEDDLPPTVHMKASDVQPGPTVVMSVVGSTPPQPPQPKGGTRPQKPHKPKPAIPPPPSRSPSVPEATVQVGRDDEPPATVVMAGAPDQTLRAREEPTATSRTPAEETARGPAVQRPQSPKPVMPSDGGVAAAARAGVPAGLIVGGALMLFMGLLGVGVVAWLKTRPEPSPSPTQAPPSLATPTPAPPPPSPVAVTGSLHVDSQPPGASVLLNGEAKGVTPLDLPGLAPGSYEVKLDLKGYDVRVETAQLTAEAPNATVSVPLARTAPVMAQADILSTPFGANVTLDGARIGQTPLTGFKLKPGTHKVDLAKDGFEPWSGTLTVKPGDRGKLDATLKALALRTPPPTPAAAVDTSRIYNNERPEVDTPAKKLSGSSTDFRPKLKPGDSVSVKVSFVILEDGTLTDLKVLESGGKDLDEAVLDAIRKWKYEPATKRGVKVKVRQAFKQTFRTG